MTEAILRALGMAFAMGWEIGFRIIGDRSGGRLPPANKADFFPTIGPLRS